jgi:hypothetical protein
MPVLAGCTLSTSSSSFSSSFLPASSPPNNPHRSFHLLHLRLFLPPRLPFLLVLLERLLRPQLLCLQFLHLPLLLNPLSPHLILLLPFSYVPLSPLLSRPFVLPPRILALFR